MSGGLGTNLAELAASATQGEWEAVCMGSEGYHLVEKQGSAPTRTTTRLMRRRRVALCVYEDWETDKANAAFIVALVNAWRAGQLIEAPTARDETGAQAYFRNLIAMDLSQRTREGAEQVIEEMTGRKMTVEQFLALSPAELLANAPGRSAEDCCDDGWEAWLRGAPCPVHGPAADDEAAWCETPDDDCCQETCGAGCQLGPLTGKHARRPGLGV